MKVEDAEQMNPEKREQPMLRKDSGHMRLLGVFGQEKYTLSAGISLGWMRSRRSR